MTKYFFTIFILINYYASSQSTFFTGGNICSDNEWKQVFSDEFDDDTLDHSVWFTYYPCNDNWNIPCEEARVAENNLWLDENVVEGDGTLKLLAKKETATWYSTTRNFTSGLIFSNGSNRFPSGKFEMYCKIPSGKGIHSAFWLFGGNGSGIATEIDVFEFLGHEPRNFHSSLWRYSNVDVDATTDCAFESIDFSLAFHLYSVEWDSFFIIFKIDDEPVCTISRFYTLSGNEVLWCCVPPGVYNIQPAYPPTQNNTVSVIASLGIGTGSDEPDISSLPAKFEIDYIRIYQRDPPSSKSFDCELLLFPNPTQDELHIKKKRMTKIRIENIQGQIVFSQEVSANEFLINIHELIQGIYFVEVQSEDGTFANKFIKY
jgi:beta-glucanase (GH16 family)